MNDPIRTPKQKAIAELAEQFANALSALAPESVHVIFMIFENEEDNEPDMLHTGRGCRGCLKAYIDEEFKESNWDHDQHSKQEIKNVVTERKPKIH